MGPRHLTWCSGLFAGLVALVGCNGPADNDSDATDVPEEPAPWNHLPVAPGVDGVVDWSDDRVLLYTAGDFDATMGVLDRNDGSYTELPGTGIGWFVPDTDGELISRPRVLHELTAQGWVAHEGWTDGLVDYVWLSGAAPLVRFDIEQRTPLTIPGAPDIRDLWPLGAGENAVFEEVSGQGRLFWASGEGVTALAPVDAWFKHRDRVVYTTTTQALFEAGVEPVDLERTLHGQLGMLVDGTVVAETGPTTVELWDGTGWTLLGDDHTIARLSYEEVVLLGSTGEVVRWSPAHGLTPGPSAVEGVRQLDDGVYLLTGAQPPLIWLPDGSWLELPVWVTGDTPFLGGVDDGAMVPRQIGEVPVWIDLTTGTLTAASLPMDDVCFTVFGGQMIYRDADGGVWRLTATGDTQIGNSCLAFALENGSTWMLGLDGEAVLIDADGVSEPVGTFESAQVEARHIVAVEFAYPPRSFGDLGRAAIQVFRPQDGAQVLATTNGTVDFFGDVVAPIPFGPGRLGVFSPGCVDCTTATTDLHVFDDQGIELTRIDHVAAWGFDPADSPYRLLVQRQQGEDRVEVWWPPEG